MLWKKNKQKQTKTNKNLLKNLGKKLLPVVSKVLTPNFVEIF